MTTHPPKNLGWSWLLLMAAGGLSIVCGAFGMTFLTEPLNYVVGGVCIVIGFGLELLGLRSLTRSSRGDRP